MTRGLNRRRNAAWRWAVLLFVSGMTGALPRVASATCGDYLQMPDHGMAHSSAPVSNERSAPLPCRGPHCRQSDPPASPSAPVSLERPHDQWACQVFATVPAWSLSQLCRRGDRVHAAAGHPLRLEKPPRQAKAGGRGRSAPSVDVL